jgi:hypothetical protein
MGIGGTLKHCNGHSGGMSCLSETGDHGEIAKTKRTTACRGSSTNPIKHDTIIQITQKNIELRIWFVFQ